MTQLNELESKQLSLEAMLIGVIEEHTSVKNDLESSFFDKKDSDKLSEKLSHLQSKRGGLNDAILSTKQEIDQEHIRINNDAKNARLDVRKSHVKSALIQLDEARPIAKELSKLLQSVLVSSTKAGSGLNNVLEDSSRKILGEILSDCKFISTSLRSVAHIHPATLKNDFDNLSNNLRGDF